MVVRYDKLNRFEKPTMILCNPGCEYDNGRLTATRGCIPATEAEELVLNFNSISELNFRANRFVSTEITTQTAESEAKRIYNDIKNRRLIFIDDIGFFVIKEVTEKYENGVSYKDVKAESADCELQQRIIPAIPNGTYRFVRQTCDTADGLIEMIVSTLPLWTIGHIDSSVGEKMRTFEDVEANSNCLSFMIDKMQDAYECIILFDTINRQINVYDQATYTSGQGVHTHIHLSEDDLIDSATVTEGSEELYTALRAIGGDNEDVLISAVNPTGENVIYNFSYYYDWMTGGLKNKLIQWMSDIEDNEAEYLRLSTLIAYGAQEYYELLEDINVLDEKIRIADRVLENIQAEASNDTIQEGLDAIGSSAQISAGKEALIAAVKADRATMVNDRADKQQDADDALDDLQDKTEDRDVIINGLKLTNRLSSLEYDELQNYIFECDYKDEYALITDAMDEVAKFEQRCLLYERAKEQLARVCEPTQEFDVDVESFVFAKEFAAMSSELATGCIITMDIADGVHEYFLSTITLNYDDKKMNLTIGNRYNKFDPRTLFENVLGSVSKSANTISYIKDTLYPLKAGEIDKVKQELQDVRNLSMANAIAATDQSVVIDSSGYTGRRSDGDGGFEDEQVKIVNNSIVFTDDNWESCSAALGKMQFPDPDNPGETVSKYGLNAEVLVGNVVLTQNLNVVNDNSTILMNEDGLRVDGSHEEPTMFGSFTVPGNWAYDADGLYWYIEDSTLYPSGFATWYNACLNGDQNGYIQTGQNTYKLDIRQHTLDGETIRYLAYNIADELEIIKPDLPAFAVLRQRGNNLFASSDPSSATYTLCTGVNVGCVTTVDHTGVSVYEQESVGSVNTSAFDHFVPAAIIQVFNNIKAKIRKLFPESVDPRQLDKVGVRIINESDRDVSALTASALAFQHTTVNGGSAEQTLTYYGADGADVPGVKARSITTDNLQSAVIFGNLYHRAGEIISLTGVPLSGDITLGAKAIRLLIPMPKDLSKIDTFTLNEFRFSTRGPSGYFGFRTNNPEYPFEIPNSSNDYTIIWDSYDVDPDGVDKQHLYMNVSFAKCGGNMLRMTIYDQYGYVKLVNNTPVDMDNNVPVTVFCKSLSITLGVNT